MRKENETLEDILKAAHRFISQFDTESYIGNAENHAEIGDLIDRTVAVMERDK